MADTLTQEDIDATWNAFNNPEFCGIADHIHALEVSYLNLKLQITSAKRRFARSDLHPSARREICEEVIKLESRRHKIFMNIDELSKRQRELLTKIRLSLQPPQEL
jgi:hypothetical protein